MANNKVEETDSTDVVSDEESVDETVSEGESSDSPEETLFSKDDGNGPSENVDSAEDGEEEKPDEAEDADDADDLLSGKTTTYEEFTLPEGMEMDSALLEKFAPIAQAANLSQEQAQALVNFWAENQVEQGGDLESQIAERQAEDKAIVQADEELGGANFTGTVQAVARCLSTFDTKEKEFRQYLRATGQANAPEVVRFLRAVGMSTKERNITTTKPAPKDLSPEEILFGTVEKGI